MNKALWIAFGLSLLAAAINVAVAVKFNLQGTGTLFIFMGCLGAAIAFSSLATRERQRR